MSLAGRPLAEEEVCVSLDGDRELPAEVSTTDLEREEDQAEKGDEAEEKIGGCQEKKGWPN